MNVDKSCPKCGHDYFENYDNSALNIADVMPSFLARLDFTTLSNNELVEICKIVKPYTGRYEIIQAKKPVLHFKLPFIGEEYKLIIKSTVQGLYHLKSPKWYKEFQPNWILYNSFKLWQYLSAKYEA